MMRRALLLALPVSLALAFAAPALADTTVGQTGIPDATSSLAPGFEYINPAAVVPGSGTVTSLQTVAATSDVCASLGTGEYDFQVLRPQGNSEYLVLGDTGNQTDPCDGQLHSYPVSISVQPGDVLGAYVLNYWAGLLTGGSRDYGGGPEPAVGQIVSLPNPGDDTLDLSGVLASSSDSDLALTNIPANITADGTSPTGAVVTYTPPTAVDDDAAQVSCSPAPGTTFAIGTTTVTCTAADADDSNSPVEATFTVNVEGAAQQLTDLVNLVSGAGPGMSLANKVARAQSELALSRDRAVCGTLDAFSREVWAQTGKKLSAGTSAQLIAAALRIEAVLGCDCHRGRW